jgi:hypothetical protein
MLLGSIVDLNTSNALLILVVAILVFTLILFGSIAGIEKVGLRVAIAAILLGCICYSYFSYKSVSKCANNSKAGDTCQLLTFKVKVNK